MPDGCGVQHLIFELTVSRSQRDVRDRAGCSLGIGVSAQTVDALSSSARTAHAGSCTALCRSSDPNRRKGNRSRSVTTTPAESTAPTSSTCAAKTSTLWTTTPVRSAKLTVRGIHSARRDVAGADRSACSDLIGSSPIHCYASYVDPSRLRPAMMLNGR